VVAPGRRQDADGGNCQGTEESPSHLDEPTSALTESEINKLMEILENLRSHGVTCIYITHKLEEFFRITIPLRSCDGKTVTTLPTSVDTETGQLHGRP
jgi:ABC-type sugar transport system ATPase subunit